MNVLTPPTVWVQLAGVLSFHDLVAVGDFILTGNPWERVLPLATFDELTAVVGRHTGRGRRALVLALTKVCDGPLSRPESLLRMLLIDAGIPAPVVNGTVADSRGSFLAMIDLGWPDYRFALEYEGDHHRSKDQFRRDIRRVEMLVDHDWIVMRVSGDDLFDRPGELISRVAARLVQRGCVMGRLDLPLSGHFRR